jgi:hypothetical protein
VPSILNDKTNVLLLGKLNSSSNIASTGDVDRITDIVT